MLLVEYTFQSTLTTLYACLFICGITCLVYAHSLYMAGDKHARIIHFCGAINTTAAFWMFAPGWIILLWPSSVYSELHLLLSLAVACILMVAVPVAAMLLPSVGARSSPTR